MLQLTIKTDLERLPAVIEANFEEIKGELDALLKQYDGLLVVADKAAIAAAKRDCADLNRLKTALDEARKRVKARCLKPYADFEAKVKELTGMIDGARAPIDRQLKAFDKARREQVAAALSDYYAAEFASIAAVVPWERIFDPAWTNATVSEANAKAYVAGKAQEIKDALGAIQDTAPADLLREAANRYAETLDLAVTLTWLRQRRERDAALAAATAPKPEPAPEPAPAVQTPPEAPAPVTDATVEMAEADAAEAARLDAADPVLTYTLRFTGRKSKLYQLKAWMAQNGVTYVKLPNNP